MDKGIIYYTPNNVAEPLFSAVQRQILEADLPIVSVSLKPIDFGKNIVLDLEPSVISMYKQILTALKHSESKYVFFCEHDVLYHPSHFEFTPPTDDTFYFNVNVWKCLFKTGDCHTYDDMRSVSGMCVNREFAVEHYKRRLDYIYKKGFDKLPVQRNPRWARVMGFEPGKKVKSGGFSEEKIDQWKSEFPNIDIRHNHNMTDAKTNPKDFNVVPTGWKEGRIETLEGWDYNYLLNLCTPKS